MSESVDMVIIEDPNFNISWECSYCKKQFKDTKKFSKSKSCPNCKKTIREWIGMDDYQDDFVGIT